MSDFSFPKSEKLCKRKQIQLLFAEGKGVQSYPLKCIYLVVNELDGNSKVLVSVPKRNFKRAVDRNRIKRLLREAYRLQKCQWRQKISAKFMIAIIFTGKEMPDYELVQRKMMSCLDKIEKEITGQN